jgi:hypothetical protein
MTKNYRIKKVTDGYSTSYYPQQKLFGLFWYNLFEGEYSSGSYHTFEEAQKHLCNFLREPVIEYLSFDCDCGESK